MGVHFIIWLLACFVASSVASIVDTTYDEPKSLSQNACSPIMREEIELANRIQRRHSMTADDVLKFYTADTFYTELSLVVNFYWQTGTTAITNFESLFSQPAGTAQQFYNAMITWFGDVKDFVDTVGHLNSIMGVLNECTAMLNQVVKFVLAAVNKSQDFRSTAIQYRLSLYDQNAAMSAGAEVAHGQLATQLSNATDEQRKLILFEAYQIVTAHFEFMSSLREAHNRLIGGYVRARGGQIQASHKWYGLSNTSNFIGWRVTNTGRNDLEVIKQLTIFNNDCLHPDDLGLDYGAKHTFQDYVIYLVQCDYYHNHSLVRSGEKWCKENMPPSDCVDCPWAVMTSEGPFAL